LKDVVSGKLTTVATVVTAVVVAAAPAAAAAAVEAIALLAVATLLAAFDAALTAIFCNTCVLVPLTRRKPTRKC
jgi:hypothetical protein